MRVWLVLLAACGRFGFDAQAVGVDAGSGCVAVGHDEDGDGVDDACDVCPHMVDDQLDSDGDGVGDACDPEPTLARQHIVYFDSFATLDPSWKLEENTTVHDDAVYEEALGDFGGIRRDITDGNELYLTHGEWLDADAFPMGSHVQIMVEAMLNKQFFYCEMYQDGTRLAWQVTYTLDGDTFQQAPGGVHGTVDWTGTSGVMSMSLVPGGDITCKTTFSPTPLETTTANVAVARQHIDLAAASARVRYDWFLQIETTE